MAREIRAPEQVNGFRDRRRSCGDCDNLRMYEGVPACIYTEREMSFSHDATDCAAFENEWSDDAEGD